MAGTKESPRQKMIGMMYLVLTALLALQVTSAILEKFVLINNSLEQSVAASSKVNQATFESIKATVAKSGNRATDLAVVKQADEVRTLTANTISELDKLKEQIVTAGGGRDESGNIKNLSEEEKVAQLMIGTARNGAGVKLKDQLNSFVDALSKYSGTKYAPMALDGKDDPIASRSPDQSKKDFAELNFAQTPVPAALAVLSQKQTDVRRLEGEVLDVLASKVGAQDVKFDNIIGMLSMDSKVVVAGTKFKGQMFLAASSTGVEPRMSLNGGSVRVQNGQGLIEFTAQGGAYDKDGLSKRTLTGSISYQSPAGLRTVPLRAEYFVAKPSYEIESGSFPPLYLGCANKLSVQSPQLGALWNPSFSADGGSVIQSGEKGKITIVPSSARVVLNVSNAGSLLGKNDFRVNRVPKPTLEFYVGGTKAGDPRGVPANQARSVRVTAVADESFRNYSPDDARFRVTGITVILARGTRKVGQVNLGPAGGSLGSLAAEIQPGDRLSLQVDGVQRQNFRGEVSEVSMGNPQQTVPLY